VTDELRFRDDLYRGAAEDYERYRPPYPPGLLTSLTRTAGVTGRGQLLDLACGTGQVALPLAGQFEQVLAVDQEPDMVRVGRLSVEGGSGLSNIEWRVGAVEDLALADGTFELVTAGNAFHRLPRQVVAGKVFGWLRPGGCFALLWGGTPWRDNFEPWQKSLSSTLERWMDAVGSRERIPAGWAEAQTAKPDIEVLREARFEVLERFSVAATLSWTAGSLAGFLYSTSFLSRAVVGTRVTEFEEDLRRSVFEEAGAGPYIQETDFACELARRPG
jgi:SAM-dependent methyltransferase